MLFLSYCLIYFQATSLGERLLVLILTQLDYTARESEFEVPYGCCPLSDPAYLLWIEHCPVGMCSLKSKGKIIDSIDGLIHYTVPLH